MRGLIAALALATPALADFPGVANQFEFCWTGGNGYYIYGEMALADDAPQEGPVTEEHVTHFKIAGFRDGVHIGSWSMTDATLFTAWRLNFDPVTQTFPVGGSAPQGTGQRWNASGAMDDCGSPGFGFNAGNVSQDICLNGTWVRDSIIDPDVPFRAYRLGTGPACPAAPQLSALPLSLTKA